VDILEALVSSIIPWKIISEYRLSRIKAKAGILLCLLKGSSFITTCRIT
jgi:hypothetical protein